MEERRDHQQHDIRIRGDQGSALRVELISHSAEREKPLEKLWQQAMGLAKAYKWAACCFSLFFIVGVGFFLFFQSPDVYYYYLYSIEFRTASSVRCEQGATFHHRFIDQMAAPLRASSDGDVFRVTVRAPRFVTLNEPHTLNFFIQAPVSLQCATDVILSVLTAPVSGLPSEDTSQGDITRPTYKIVFPKGHDLIQQLPPGGSVERSLSFQVVAEPEGDLAMQRFFPVLQYAVSLRVKQGEGNSQMLPTKSSPLEMKVIPLPLNTLGRLVGVVLSALFTALFLPALTELARQVVGK